MKIHTTLTARDMWGLTADLSGVSLHDLTEHRSTIRPRAFALYVTGTGGPTNTGQYGAGDRPGATWDEWGAVFGRLYAADPSAVCGGTFARPIYRDADHFTWITGGRFTGGVIPADTHKRHRWDYAGDVVTGSYTVHTCRKCSAIVRRVAEWRGYSWADITGDDLDRFPVSAPLNLAAARELQLTAGGVA